MYGYISNNLASKINNYLNLKSMTIGFQCAKPINDKNVTQEIKKIQQSEISTLIVDTSCFYNDELALKFLYEIKLNCEDLRIICLSFTKQLLSEIAMIGIYDLVYYNKKILLETEIDELLIRKKKLSDIQEFLSIDTIIKQSRKTEPGKVENKIYLALSLDRKIYKTTTIASILQTTSRDNICFVEVNNVNNLSDQLQARGFNNTEDFSGEYYQVNSNTFIFNNLKEWTKEQTLNILLHLQGKFDCIIFDFGYSENLKDIKLQEILKHVDHILVFDTNSMATKSNEKYHILKGQIDGIEKSKSYLTIPYKNENELEVKKISEETREVLSFLFDDEKCYKSVVTKFKSRIKDFSNIKYGVKNKSV